VEPQLARTRVCSTFCWLGAAGPQTLVIQLGSGPSSRLADPGRQCVGCRVGGVASPTTWCLGIGVVLVLTCCSSNGTEADNASAGAPTASDGEERATSTAMPDRDETPSAATPESSDVPWWAERAGTLANEIVGTLPNGQDYVVRSDTDLRNTVEGISAGVLIDLNNGQPAVVVGIGNFQRVTGTQQTGVDDRTGYVRVVSGDWYLELQVYDHVIAQLGDETAATILDAIVPAAQPQHASALPSFELLAPLRWADDIELPLHMMVMYPDFVVRRGCSDFSVACSTNGAIEVVPGEEVHGPESSWQVPQIEITTAHAQAQADGHRAAMVNCLGLDVFGVDPSGEFTYCLTAAERGQYGPGLRTVMVNDGSGFTFAFADEERSFRLARWRNDDPASWFRFVDPRTAVWRTESSIVLGRRDDTGVFVDVYEFLYPFHDYDLAPGELDGNDLRIFAPAFVNSAAEPPAIDLSRPLIDNFAEASARSEGSWYSGDTLSETPTCGASTLYRDEVDGFSRVLNPAIELDTVQKVASTQVLSGPAVHSGWRFRTLAIAVACPEQYEGIRIYVGNESIDYGDNGPASNPQVLLWGSYPTSQQDESAPQITTPIIGQVGLGPFAELLSIEFENIPEPETVPQTVIVTAVDLDGVEHRLTVHNEVGSGPDGLLLRTE